MILAFFDILKILQRLYSENVLLTVFSDFLQARLDQVIQEYQVLVDVIPVPSAALEPFSNHLHDLAEGDDVVHEVGDFGHNHSPRLPWIVRGSLPRGLSSAGPNSCERNSLCYDEQVETIINDR